MASVSLTERTQELLRTRPRNVTYEVIAKALHPENVPAFTKWLTYFNTGRIQYPSVDNVQAVYEFLSGKPLFND